ncbi:hypothetical protein JXA85_00865 [Candidatus Woesearchaeota archaeon]|nr:hypothetical protein [Candidatus Woesearchaeota archaeon]
MNHIKWRKLGKWKYSVLFKSLDITSKRKNFLRLAGIDYRIHNYIYINNEVLLSEDDFQNQKDVYLNAYKKDNKFFTKYLGRCLKHCNNLVNFSKRVKRQDVKRLSKEDLLSLFREYVYKFKCAGAFLTCFQSLDSALNELVINCLADFLDNDKLIDDNIRLIIVPKKRVMMSQEKYDLLKLAHFIQYNNQPFYSPIVKRRINHHRLKYSWMNTYLYVGLPHDNDYYVSRLKELLRKDCGKEIIKIETMENSDKKKANRTIGTFKKNKRLYGLANVIRDFIWLRPYRIDIHNIVFSNLIPFFTEIATRVGLSLQELLALTETEIIDSVRGKTTDKTTICDRLNDFCLIKQDEKIEILSGKELLKAKEMFREDYSDVREVNGRATFNGNAKGKAKIILNLDDMNKVEAGDIMVVPMTDPNYVPAMEKAAAFVTDEGGILCHAAIVSREMKKPCIVGTHIATKVFKDGDFIELDANTGVVRKVG